MSRPTLIDLEAIRNHNPETVTSNAELLRNIYVTVLKSTRDINRADSETQYNECPSIKVFKQGLEFNIVAAFYVDNEIYFFAEKENNAFTTPDELKKTGLYKRSCFVNDELAKLFVVPIPQKKFIVSHYRSEFDLCDLEGISPITFPLNGFDDQTRGDITRMLSSRHELEFDNTLFRMDLGTKTSQSYNPLSGDWQDASYHLLRLNNTKAFFDRMKSIYNLF